MDKIVVFDDEFTEDEIDIRVLTHMKFIWRDYLWLKTDEGFLKMHKVEEENYDDDESYINL